MQAETMMTDLADRPAPRMGRNDGCEQAVRRDLAAAYRLLALFGMDEGTDTLISARVPCRHDQLLINRFGRLCRDVRASSLIKVDLQGRASGEPRAAFQPAGFTIHSALHAARPDAACILHSHTVAGVAVASLMGGLQPCNQWALQFHNRIEYHDFEGIDLDAHARERLVADLGPSSQALILRNYGLLTVGRSVAEAFILMHNLERACRVQVAIQSTGRAVYPVPEAVRERTARQYERASGQLPVSHHPADQLPADPLDHQDQQWQALLARLGPAPTSSYQD